MYIEINETNPDSRQIREVVEALRNGALFIYPTDSVYAMGCDPESKIGVQKLFNIKNADPKSRPMTFMCDGISMAAKYAAFISNPSYRFIKDHTPGPYTFILKAGHDLPKLLGAKHKTLGFRIPSNKIALSIIEMLERPILSSSLKRLASEDSEEEFYINPEEIFSDYSLLVDGIINGGAGTLEVSTIIDMTEEVPNVVREGAGEVEFQ